MHKSVHGCIVDIILNVSNLVILKNNGKDIPGQTVTLRILVGVQKSQQVSKACHSL